MNSKLSEISAIDYEPKIPSENIEHEGESSEKFSHHNVPPSERTIEHPLSCFQNTYPKWMWEPNPQKFVWKPDFIACTLRSYATMSQNNRETCLGFLHSLTWIQDPSYTRLPTLNLLLQLGIRMFVVVISLTIPKNMRN